MTSGRKIFEEIRDRPYSVIERNDAKPQQCFHKNTELIARLSQLGYGVRGRVGEIAWEDLGLPAPMIALYPMDIMPTHFYCEIWRDGAWHVLDASWDPPMKAVDAVSGWDTPNVPGFTVRKIYSIEEQTAFFDYWSDAERGDDYVRRASGFLAGFDDWVIEQRAKALT